MQQLRGAMFASALTIVVHFTTGTPAWSFEDCNVNGLDDASELAICPSAVDGYYVDVVFLIDTSGSVDEVLAVCDMLDIIMPDLGEGFRGETLAIGEPYGGHPLEDICRCCTDIVPNVYGTTTLGLPAEYELGTCGGDPLSQRDEEDWGPATAVVAGEKAWTPGPRCGGGWQVEDPINYDDEAVIEIAKQIARDNRVIVAPLVLFVDDEPCVPPDEQEVQIEALATVLAQGAYPGGKVFRWDDENLAAQMADMIRTACPEDCDSNGVIDACDVLDCLEELWCADCNYNGVPDNCELDCNENDVLDECDIAEGTSEDCNGDGVPAECDFDCNSNSVPDECEIANQALDFAAPDVYDAAIMPYRVLGVAQTPWGKEIGLNLDEDEDEDVDLVVIFNGISSNEGITVFLNDGDGADFTTMENPLKEGQSLPAYSNPHGVCAGDFNDDDLPDVAVTVPTDLDGETSPSALICVNLRIA